MQNNQIRNAKIEMVIAIVVQAILCCLNIKLFGIAAGALLIYIIYGLVQAKKNPQYWIKMQCVTTVIIILEFLFGFSIEYLFQNII